MGEGRIPGQESADPDTDLREFFEYGEDEILELLPQGFLRKRLLRQGRFRLRLHVREKGDYLVVKLGVLEELQQAHGFTFHLGPGAEMTGGDDVGIQGLTVVGKGSPDEAVGLGIGPQGMARSQVLETLLIIAVFFIGTGIYFNEYLYHGNLLRESATDCFPAVADRSVR